MKNNHYNIVRIYMLFTRRYLWRVPLQTYDKFKWCMGNMHYTLSIIAFTYWLLFVSRTPAGRKIMEDKLPWAFIPCLCVKMSDLPAIMTGCLPVHVVFTSRLSPSQRSLSILAISKAIMNNTIVMYGFWLLRRIKLWEIVDRFYSMAAIPSTSFIDLNYGVGEHVRACSSETLITAYNILCILNLSIHLAW